MELITGAVANSAQSNTIVTVCRIFINEITRAVGAKFRLNSNLIQLNPQNKPDPSSEMCDLMVHV